MLYVYIFGTPATDLTVTMSCGMGTSGWDLPWILTRYIFNIKTVCISLKTKLNEYSSYSFGSHKKGAGDIQNKLQKFDFLKSKA